MTPRNDPVNGYARFSTAAYNLIYFWYYMNRRGRDEFQRKNAEIENVYRKVSLSQNHMCLPCAHVGSVDTLTEIIDWNHVLYNIAIFGKNYF